MAYLDLIEALKAKEFLLKGELQRRDELLVLQESLPRGVPDWFLDIMCQFALCGSEFELSERDDQSGLGASLGWLKPEGILSEAKDYQPGISVHNVGFLPFGSDLTGSGDPYFLDLREESDDPMVVRVPHDFAVEREYPLDKVEPVCPLSELIRASEV